MSGRIIEIRVEDAEEMEAELRTLCARCGAQAVVLLDLSGAVLVAHRVPGNIDNLLFGSLLSSNFAATEELSHRLGVEEFKVMFHEGKRQNLYFQRITEDTVLVVLFSDSNAMGRVRLFCEKSAPDFSKFIDGLLKRGGVAPPQGRHAADYLARIAKSFQIPAAES